MPKRQKDTSGVVMSPRGKKTTFDDEAEAENEQPVASSSRLRHPAVQSEDYDSDDDAPEAVTLTQSKSQSGRGDEDYAIQQQEAKKRAAAERSRRIAQLKNGSKGRKSFEKEEVEDDEELDEGSSEDPDGGAVGDEDNETGDEDEDGNDDEDGDDLAEDEEEASNADTETLDEGPLDEDTIRMRARMDAAMAAADRRAAAAANLDTEDDEASEDDEESIEEVAEMAELSSVKTQPVDEDRQWDLSRVQPLSIAALEKARKAHERKHAEKAAALVAKRETREKNKKRKRRTKLMQETTRVVGDTTVQLLAPRLDLSLGGMPPVQAVKKQKNGRDAREKFLKRTMKQSGIIPGRGIVDGRKKAPSFTVR